MVVGDYNAKNTLWGSRLTTLKGKQLYHAIKEYACEYHSTAKSTYWPTDGNKIKLGYLKVTVLRRRVGEVLVVAGRAPAC
jgi:hypothetical protein